MWGTQPFTLVESQFTGHVGHSITQMFATIECKGHICFFHRHWDFEG